MCLEALFAVVYSRNDLIQTRYKYASLYKPLVAFSWQVAFFLAVVTPKWWVCSAACSWPQPGLLRWNGGCGRLLGRKCPARSLANTQRTMGWWSCSSISLQKRSLEFLMISLTNLRWCFDSLPFCSNKYNNCSCRAHTADPTGNRYI